MASVKSSLKALSLVAVGLALAAGSFWSWRMAPVDVPVAAIEKVMETDESPTALADCQKFSMTTEEFRLYFKQAKRIFGSEAHDYNWLPCYYRMIAAGREYRVRNGGLAEVRQGGQIRLYVRRDLQRSIVQ